MAGNFFRGTTVEQDGRWGKSDKKMIEKMTKSGKFAAILEKKVDLTKVNMDIISKWVSERITQILGFEDEIVINLTINTLETKTLEPKRLQFELTGFLEKSSGQFVEELWTLLLDAQDQPSGIPSAFIQKKKEEIINRQKRSSGFSDGPDNTKVSADTTAITVQTKNSLVTESHEQSSIVQQEIKPENQEKEQKNHSNEQKDSKVHSKRARDSKDESKEETEEMLLRRKALESRKTALFDSVLEKFYDTTNTFL
eukprot:gene5395-10784_t